MQIPKAFKGVPQPSNYETISIKLLRIPVPEGALDSPEYRIYCEPRGPLSHAFFVGYKGVDGINRLGELHVHATMEEAVEAANCYAELDEEMRLDQLYAEEEVEKDDGFDVDLSVEMGDYSSRSDR